ncbi:hypothetical protein V7V80_03860 [Pseudomonas kermanshahensis]|uniref:Uncharacterized protein n=1 Tax=Pseudomonas kermanshahensis TaxID=2745482 RepID=A0ABU8R1R4_9PSED
MSKPDWNIAPHWANWLAADTTIDPSKPEYWVWFEDEPVWNDSGWLLGEGGGKWDQTAFDVPVGYDTPNSLERRP